MLRFCKPIFVLFVCAVALSSCSKTSEEPQASIDLLKRTWNYGSIALVVDSKESTIPNSAFTSIDLSEMTFKDGGVLTTVDSKKKSTNTTWKDLGGNQIEMVLDGSKRVFKIGALTSTELVLNTATIDLAALDKKSQSQITPEEEDVLLFALVASFAGVKIDDNAKTMGVSLKFKAK